VREYSAAATKFSFWFNEYRLILNLIEDGRSKEEIKTISHEYNIFSTPSKERGDGIIAVVYNRVTSLSEGLNGLMDISDIETQKIIVLVSIMRTEPLFFDFMYEVFREKIITRDTILADLDIRTFFRYKQETNDIVKKWTEESLNKLKNTYKLYLAEAGLTNRAIGDRTIIRPYLDTSLKSALVHAGMDDVIKAFGCVDQ